MGRSYPSIAIARLGRGVDSPAGRSSVERAGHHCHGHPNEHRRPVVQYAILIYDEETASPSSAPADPETWKEVAGQYDAYTRMLRDRGAYKGGEALQPVTSATTIRVRDGQTLTTDGPFAETKEALGGFYLIEAADLDEALRLAADCPGARYGSIEIRPVADFSEGA
jgi:hypothetical protein